MKKTGWKNAAGQWVRQQLLARQALASMLFAVIAGCAFGFWVRGVLVFNEPGGILASSVAMGVAILAGVVVFAYCRRLDATWSPGLQAEQRIGDLIDYAVTQGGCAFAHDVREALGDGLGNVDHVVMTPAGIWVVETKAHRVPKSRFSAALRQVAENVGRVRSHLETSLPVRGALVIADRSEDELEEQFDWKGEALLAFGAKRFLRALKAECEQTGTDVRSPEMAWVAHKVWDLGSRRHLGS